MGVAALSGKNQDKVHSLAEAYLEPCPKQLKELEAVDCFLKKVSVIDFHY